MSEEEAIKILKEINIVDFYNTYTDSTTDFSEPRKYCDAIEVILNLYNKQKEENRKLRQCHLRYEEMTGIDLLLEK